MDTKNEETFLFSLFVFFRVGGAEVFLRTIFQSEKWGFAGRTNASSILHMGGGRGSSIHVGENGEYKRRKGERGVDCFPHPRWISEILMCC